MRRYVLCAESKIITATQIGTVIRAVPPLHSGDLICGRKSLVCKEPIEHVGCDSRHIIAEVFMRKAARPCDGTGRKNSATIPGFKEDHFSAYDLGVRAALNLIVDAVTKEHSSEIAGRFQEWKSTARSLNIF